jgi:hypothetical protein
MRAAVAALLALMYFISGCSTDRCKKGTVLLTVSLTNGAEAANFIDVQLSIDGGTSQTQIIPHTVGSTSGSIEVDFKTYPSGGSLAFAVIARSDAQVLAEATQATAATPICTTVGIALDGGQSATSDLGADDVSGGLVTLGGDWQTGAIELFDDGLETADWLCSGTTCISGGVVP